MLTCKEATHLLSEAQDGKLPFAQRLQLELHLLFCKGCTNFKEQMAFLRRACSTLSRGREQDRNDRDRSS